MIEYARKNNKPTNVGQRLRLLEKRLQRNLSEISRFSRSQKKPVDAE